MNKKAMLKIVYMALDNIRDLEDQLKTEKKRLLIIEKELIKQAAKG